MVKFFGCPEQCFLRVGCPKRHPDALLAKTMLSAPYRNLRELQELQGSPGLLVTPNFVRQLSDNFGDIFVTNAIFRTIFKKNYSCELYLQLSFKYFENLCFVPKLFPKVRQVQK